MTFNNVRGDFNRNRLFFDLTPKGLKVDMIYSLKPNVIFIETNQGPKILKGFRSKSNLYIQNRFTKSLISNGFKNTSVIEILENERKEYLFANNLYWGISAFIPKQQEFTFSSSVDRKNGLQTLFQFHTTTEKLVPFFQRHIDYYSLYEKWLERHQTFVKNSATFEYYFGKKKLDYIYYLSIFSLSCLYLFYRENENKRYVMIHGDVAHHNFIRSTNNQVFLLDFDLIKIAPKSIDILQYTNRILPFINWSYDELRQIDMLTPYLTKKWFLTCLVFPQDIFREWFRLLMDIQSVSVNNEKIITDINMNIDKRKWFVEKIINMVR